MIGESVMARFTLILFAACAIGTGVASALDDAVVKKESLKNATRKELLAKIADLEQQLTDLKSQQKQRNSQHESLAKWLTYTAPLTGQVSPVPTSLPPGTLTWPSYSDPNSAGSHYPAMPNAYQEQSLDLPKGVTARPFNGVTVYNIPCVHRTVNGVPETTSRVVSQPSVKPVRKVDRNSNRQLVPQQDALRRRR